MEMASQARWYTTVVVHYLYSHWPCHSNGVHSAESWTTSQSSDPPCNQGITWYQVSVQAVHWCSWCGWGYCQVYRECTKHAEAKLLRCTVLLCREITSSRIWYVSEKRMHTHMAKVFLVSGISSRRILTSQLRIATHIRSPLPQAADLWYLQPIPTYSISFILRLDFMSIQHSNEQLVITRRLSLQYGYLQFSVY